MALMCRRKAFCIISRYRLCGRFSFSSSSTGSSSPVPPPPSLTQTPAWKQLRPSMAMHSSLAAPPSSACKCTTTTSVPFFTTRNYTAPAFFVGKGKEAPCCFTHKCTSKCGCSCTATSVFLSSARNCTTTAYPPPTPPGEFQGGDEDGEADGAPLNVDESAELPPEGNEDFDMPPFDDANNAEDDGDYVDEDPPPDPEEALLFSPSDSD